MSIICFSLLLLLLLLLPLQALCARPLGVAVRSNKDLADEETTLVHHPSYKNDNETTIDVPSKEMSATTSPARDQNETLEDNNNNKDQVKSRVTPSSASKEGKKPAVMVSWKLPDHQKNKKRRKKTKTRRGGISHHPELALDYAPPRVHPPCHN